jgi:hypothetical protein
MSEKKWALVSTVDSMGEDFPGFCVMLFETEAEALFAAVALILKHDPNTSVDYDTGEYIVGNETVSSPGLFLETWQDGLDMTEYFHVMPVNQPVHAV